MSYTDGVCEWYFKRGIIRVFLFSIRKRVLTCSSRTILMTSGERPGNIAVSVSRASLYVTREGAVGGGADDVLNMVAFGMRQNSKRSRSATRAA